MHPFQQPDLGSAAAVARGMRLYRDDEDRRMVRAFTTDMFADFTVVELRDPERIEAAGQYYSNLQMEAMEPGEYTIQFSVMEITPGLGGPRHQIPAPRAQVVWKVAGQQTRRLMSIYSGAVIGGLAEAVHVKLQDQAGAIPSLSKGGTYKVVGMLTRGTRPPAMQPPILVTQPAIEIVNGGSQRFAVPVDSGVISFYPQVVPVNPTDGAFDPSLVRAYMLSGGGTVISGITAGAGSFIPVPVPLVPGTHIVEVFNSWTDNVWVQLVWGIEG
ncbi:MAG: hypothetical protein FWD12_05205 [Alphaproteobacteria bacterium]|nr:hypothetical protein [Alphaproteobacteria bacterium]